MVSYSVGEDFEIWCSWIWRRKILVMERGSRVGMVVMALPRSTTVAYPLSSADKSLLFSITWKDITVKNVRTPVSSLRRDSS